jgi:hypothetical protein
MRQYFFIVGLFLFAPVFANASDVSTYKITFKTLACDGSEGFGSVNADKIVKIESTKCQEGDAMAKVYQLLVNSEGGVPYAYIVFTTSEKEAERIMKRVDKFQDDKAESLRNSPRVIIDR